MTELPAVARNINLPCKKCGVERYHVVVAHTTAQSAKVKCEVCGAQKTFKLPKAQARKSTAKPRSTKSPKIDVGAIWTELNEKIGAAKAQPYNMKAKFELATAINHPKFGIGFVTMATNEKIDVHFQEGSRSLVHNRT